MPGVAKAHPTNYHGLATFPEHVSAITVQDVQMLHYSFLLTGDAVKMENIKAITEKYAHFRHILAFSTSDVE